MSKPFNELYDKLTISGIWEKEGPCNGFMRTVYVQILDDDYQVIKTSFFEVNMNPEGEEYEIILDNTE